MSKLLYLVHQGIFIMKAKARGVILWRNMDLKNE